MTQRVFSINFSKVYPLYVQKAERKRSATSTS